MLTPPIQIIVALILLLLLCFIFTGTGLLLLKSIGLRTSSGEAVFLGLAAGMGLTGYLVFLLASLELLRPVPLYSLLALLFTGACWGWKGGVTRGIIGDLAPRQALEKAACAGTMLLLALGLLLALTPEIGKDALAYHLAVPRIYLHHHGFIFIPGNFFANIPLHTEMLYLVGLFLHGEILAKGIAFIAFPAILMAIRQFSTGCVKNEYPWMAMFVFAMIPSMFELSHMAYTDLHVALYAMGAVYTFLAWYNNGEKAWLFLCAMFTGLAVSCKYSTLLFPFLGCLGVLWRHRGSTEARTALRDIAFYLVLLVVFGAPFYVKNWIITGNPFYPFMFQIFGGKGLDADLARLFDGLYKYMGMGRNWSDFLLLPWNLSFNAKMNSTRFDGIISPVFIIALPFLAGIRNPGTNVKMIMVYCLASFLFWASASQDIRYLSPVLPFLALLIGIILSRYNKRRGIIVILGAGIAGCLVFNAFYIATDFMKIMPLRAVMGLEGREAFLSRMLPPYGMYRYANDHLPPDAKVYLVYMKNYIFLCDRDCYSDAIFQNYTLMKVLDASTTADDVKNRVKNMGFTHIMYDETFTTGEKSLLSAEKKNLFADFREKHLFQMKNEGSYYLFRIQS